MTELPLSRSLAASPRSSLARTAKLAFVRIGVLPVLLIIALVCFTAMSGNFLSTRNLMNVARQSSYLTIVSLGQMLALIAGGIDLSVGTTLAVTSVVSALAMVAALNAFPDMIWLAIVAGMVSGLLVGSIIGLINGAGVALLGVNPFMMTLGMTSVGFGIALYLTSGVPVYGMPEAFGAVLGFGTIATVPIPIYVTLLLVVLMYVLLNWTRLGRYIYAVGGNMKAARLSGINSRSTLLATYLMCSGLTTIAGLMLTARLSTGEANIGASMPLESIAACVIGGVGLSGGIGRVGGVVLGALFIGLVQNGMNLARIDSYLQMVVIGTILVVAVIADRLRTRFLAELHS
ncbi:ABC transporter permease [Shinella sumterensis]|uniref:ABC transporter permease n=1 Tax=Shinella sumterensis TaxID=1967501 RepID=UPI00106E1F50|nr:ABC transporter permease [Shinella sumterensis]MCD1265392.1 ABC transporter permease [Shinella sumterensis]TFE93756.1 ABC transporter permease [Shinella sumterensis]